MGRGLGEAGGERGAAEAGNTISAGLEAPGKGTPGPTQTPSNKKGRSCRARPAFCLLLEFSEP